MKTTLITEPYKHINPIIIILSLIILVPVGVAGCVVSIIFIPLGLIILPIFFIVSAAGFSALFKVAKVECPHCGNEINVTKNAKNFKCKICKRKISKINETLEAI